MGRAKRAVRSSGDERHHRGRRPNDNLLVIPRRLTREIGDGPGPALMRAQIGEEGQ